MKQNELLDYVRQHQDAARMLVKLLDRMVAEIDSEDGGQSDQETEAESDLMATYDEIAPFGLMRRTKAYQIALDMGKSRVVPTYLDEDEQILFKYVSNGYISIARNLNVGLQADDCVLLTLDERNKVQQADKEFKQWSRAQGTVSRLEMFMRENPAIAIDDGWDK